MPMLTTLVSRSPVTPRRSPERTASANRRHPVEDVVHLGYDVVAAVLDDRARRAPKGDVEDRPVLGEVDVLAGEHGIPKALDLGRPGQIGEQCRRSAG